MAKKGSDLSRIMEKINSDSEYQKKVIYPKKYMTVREMGDLLGIRKTERYWLVHKNRFQTEIIFGKMMVNIDSFENWYANQIKYKKITGEEPGKELKKRSYSIPDLAVILGVTEERMYDIVRRYDIPYILVDYWKRIPRDVFWDWYYSQTKYRTLEDQRKDFRVELATISMPEMARLLGVPREKVYSILSSKKYKDMFEIIILAEQKRITRKSFEKFLKNQDEYKLVDKSQLQGKIRKRKRAQKREEKPKNPNNNGRAVLKIEAADKKAANELADSAIAEEEPLTELEMEWERELAEIAQKEKENSPFYSMEEAARLAGVKRPQISRWYSKGYFPVKKAGRKVLVEKEPFLHWLKERKERDT